MNGLYVVNLGEYSDIGTHWVPLYALNNNVTYFDSFGFNIFQKKPKKFINRSKIVTNIFRIQTYDSVICGYFCIGFIDFMRKIKSLTDFTNLFSPNYFEKKDDTILKYFMTNF